VVAGVALGLARWLGVDPVIVRIGFVVLSFAGAVGLILYGALWALLPSDDEVPSTGPQDAAPTSRRATVQQGVALGLITLGSLLLLRRLGLWFGDALVFPILLAAVGSAIVWTRSDAEDRARLTRGIRLPGGRRVFAQAAAAPASPIRLIVGTLLVAGAVAGFLAANDALVALRDLGIALLAALVGVSMLFGPWLWRLAEQLATERRERIRQEERAEVAAHLHDSVLQTLALIQRSSDQPQRMVALARRQERELRAWLFDRPAADADQTLISAVTAVAEEVEAMHAATVEVVGVGDAPLDDRARALVGGLREAIVNAAKHSGTASVDVYLEVDDRELVAFVRDRGRGFELASIPEDRRGIRSSIIDRLERHGGGARINSTPGHGTEVELSVPRRRSTINGATPQDDEVTS
jgi:signal transduction histidine kinase/phage shock protein PspC (stress-responsive transcriptional regulator)